MESSYSVQPAQKYDYATWRLKTMSKYDAAIIGGGFAGLSAAVKLSSHNFRVVVLESRPKLGGRATSYTDHFTNDEVDNGQHVMFGCYRETLRFLRTIGADKDVHIQDRLRVSYVDENSRPICFACPDLSAPLHLIGGVLEWKELSFSEKLSALRMVGPLRRLRRRKNNDFPADIVTEDETVHDWLIRCGQARRLRELLWEPLALAALNQSARVASAKPFARVLGELCGSQVTDSAIVLPNRPLESLYAIPARRFIETHGGAVWTRAAGRVALVDGRLVGVEARNQLLDAPVVIVAVPWFALSRVINPVPPSLVATVERAEAMDSAAIVSVHLWFKSPVTTEPFLGLLGKKIQWLFANQSSARSSGARVTLVSSAAESLVGLPDAAIIELVLSDLRLTIPAVDRIELVHGMVIRERQATFSLAPGQPQRPDSQTGISGLFLAGDWIETGLPGTIESAVASGHNAANLAFEQFHQ